MAGGGARLRSLRGWAVAVDGRWGPSARTRAAGHWRWVGGAAAGAVAATSWLCGATPKEFASVWPGIVPWRSNGGSPLACTVLFVALGVMLYAWWALRDLQVSARWVRGTVVVWFSPLLLSAPLFSRDIYSYAASGLLMVRGGDPYVQSVRDLSSPWVASVSRVWLDTPAPYGPLFMELARLAAVGSGGHLIVAVALLRLLAVGAVVIIGWAVMTSAALLGTDPNRAAWLGLLTPIMGMHLVAGAHNDALMVAAMMSAVVLALRRRYGWAGVVLAAAMAIKAPAVVMLPFVAILAGADCHHRPLTWVRLLARSVVFATGVVVAFAVFCWGTGLGWSWLGNLSTPGESVQWTSLPTGLGMGVEALGTLFGRRLGSGPVVLLRDAGLVALGAVLIVLWLRAATRARDRRHVVLCGGLAMLATVVLAPAFHPWYFLWALPLLAVTVTDRRSNTALAGVASVLVPAVLPGGFSLALDTAWVGVPLCFVCTTALGVRLVRRARSASRHGIFTMAGTVDPAANGLGPSTRQPGGDPPTYRSSA